MKKIIIYVLALLIGILSVQSLKAQVLSGGLRGEVSTSSVKITDIPNQSLDVIKGDGIVGVGLGAYVQANVLMLFVKPSVMFKYHQGTVSVTNREGATTNQTYSVQKVDIPLMFGIHLGPAFLQGGPVYNWVIGSTRNFDGNDVAVQPTGLGYRVGAGVEIGRVTLDVNYQGGKNNSRATSLSSYQLPNQLIFGLGIGLGKTEK